MKITHEEKARDLEKRRNDLAVIIAVSLARSLQYHFWRTKLTCEDGQTPYEGNDLTFECFLPKVKMILQYLMKDHAVAMSKTLTDCDIPDPQSPKMANVVAAILAATPKPLVPEPTSTPFDTSHWPVNPTLTEAGSFAESLEKAGKQQEAEAFADWAFPRVKVDAVQ